jgi:L-threonylcarbamoyladenylate synthase
MIISGHNPLHVQQAADALCAGELLGLPTETVYGLAADACNQNAVAKIFEAKGRPSNHPLIVHLADAGQLDDWAADVSPTAHLLADAFWPGPLTLLVERSSSVSLAVTGGRSTVGLRVPDHTVALELLRAFGGGIAAPSANRFGRVSPTTAAHVVADLGDDVDLVLDGGACRVGVESTIVDLTREVPVVLRAGGISIDRLEEVLGHVVEVHVSAEPSKGGARAPGMLEAHYAPEARIVLSSEHDVIDAVNNALAAAIATFNAPARKAIDDAADIEAGDLTSSLGGVALAVSVLSRPAYRFRDGSRASRASRAARYAHLVTPEELAVVVRGALTEIAANGDFSITVPGEVHLERPRNRDHGDYATNVALTLAKAAEAYHDLLK